MPPEMSGHQDGTLAQILLKLGEVSTQLAVMQETLKAIPDHETRLRTLERFRYTMLGVSVVLSGGAGYVGYLLGHAH